MIRIYVTRVFREKLYKKLKTESKNVYQLIESLKESPSKGKQLAIVNGNLLRELKYKSYRFYFILEKNKLMLYDKEALSELLIKFIEISKKNDQEETIADIKKLLKELEFEDVL